MKKLFFLTILYWLFTLNTQAQSDLNVSGFIQDVEGNPISYVNVGIVGTSIGTVSKADGSFSIFFKETVSKNDTLRFSIIGYQSQSFLIKDLQAEENIILEDQTFELGEVVVRPQLSQRKTIGRSKVKGNRNVNFLIAKKPRQNMGAEVGKKFKIKNTSTKIESIRFYLRYNNFSSAKFRISFYSIKKNLPDKHLIDKDIIVTVNDQKTGWVDVDLSTYDIFTKKDFIATVQWIDASADGKNLSIPIRFPVFGKKHFYKYGSQAKWKRFKNMSISMTVGLAY